MASKNTTVVIVILACVAVALLAMCAVGISLVSWSARKVGQFAGEVGQEIEKEMQRQQFAENWQPLPDDVGPEGLFPEQVAGFRRTSHDERAAVPEYDIDVPGRHAVYEAGAGKIDLDVYRASKLEAEALIRRVADTIDERESGYRFQMGSPESGRYRYEINPPSEKGYLWSSKGWLFFFRTHDEPDLIAFADEYLKSIEGGPELDSGKQADE